MRFLEYLLSDINIPSHEYVEGSKNNFEFIFAKNCFNNEDYYLWMKTEVVEDFEDDLARVYYKLYGIDLYQFIKKSHNIQPWTCIVYTPSTNRWLTWGDRLKEIHSNLKSGFDHIIYLKDMTWTSWEEYIEKN